MARLTHKFYTYGNACKKPLVTDKDVWNRLAAYEDTGLTPEEASVLKNSNQHNLDCYVAEHDDSKALRAENARLENERNYWNGSARTLEGAVGTLNRQIDEARDENARLQRELEAAKNSLVSLMAATREGCRLCENAQYFDRNGTRPCEPILRGPCAENGGADA